MPVVNGLYKNGIVRLEKPININKSIKVTVTFSEDDFPTNKKKLTINDFSFIKAREKSKRYIGELSEAIIDERKSAL